MNPSRLPLGCCLFVVILCVARCRPSDSGLETSDPDTWRYLSLLTKGRDVGYLSTKRAAKDHRFPVAFSKRAPITPIGFFPDESPMSTRSYPMGVYGSRAAPWEHLPLHKDDSLGFFPTKRSSSIGFLPDDDGASFSNYRSSWSPYLHSSRQRAGNDIGFLPYKRTGFLPAEGFLDYRVATPSWSGLSTSRGSDIGFFPSSGKRSWSSTYGTGFLPSAAASTFSSSGPLYGWQSVTKGNAANRDDIGFFPASKRAFLPAENSVLYHSGAGRNRNNNSPRPPCHVTKTLWGFYCCDVPYGASDCNCAGPNGATFFC